MRCSWTSKKIGRGKCSGIFFLPKVTIVDGDGGDCGDGYGDGDGGGCDGVCVHWMF